MKLRYKLPFFNWLAQLFQKVSGVPPLVLRRSRAGGLTRLTAYGGLLQSNVPSGYTQIDGATKQRGNGIGGKFDTGLEITNDDVKIEILVKAGNLETISGGTTMGSFYACQARAASNGPIFGISGSLTGDTITSIVNGSSITSTITRTTGHIYLIRSEYKSSTQTLYVKDLTTNTEDTQTGTYTFAASTTNFFVFGNSVENNRLNAGNAVYYCKIWDSGTLVFDSVSVKRNSDNAVGLYDYKTSRFIAPIGTFTAGSETVPTPDAPIDLVCNNGTLKVLDKSSWTIFTNPTSQAGQGVYISPDGKWYNANDRGAGCAIPLTTGKQYTLAIHKKTVGLGTMLRYGQSPQANPTGVGIRLTDWYRGSITNGQMVSFVAKLPYLVVQLSADAVEAGMIQEAVEVLEAQGGDYTFLEYIGATGTQYIDTGILAANDIKAEVKYKPTSLTANPYCALGGRDTASTAVARNAFCIWANVNGHVRFDYQSHPVLASASSTANWNIAIKDGIKNYLNGVAEGDSTASTFTSSNNIYLFAAMSGSGYGVMGQMVGLIAYCKIWKAGVLVRDFIPAIRNSDNAVGMYDAVSGTFFGNAGTGVFTAGPVIGSGEVLKLTPGNDTAGVANLLKIGNYVDAQEILTGLVNHQLGVYVFNGTENITVAGNTTVRSLMRTTTQISDCYSGPTSGLMCSHFLNKYDLAKVGCSYRYLRYFYFTYYPDATAADFKQFLADQYNAGTPVIVVYPLETPVTEQVTPQALDTGAGTNTLEITQASLPGLELAAEYKRH